MKHLGQNLFLQKHTAIPQLSYTFRQLFIPEIFDIYGYGENCLVILITTHLPHFPGSLQCFKMLLALSPLPSFLIKLRPF